MNTKKQVKFILLLLICSWLPMGLTAQQGGMWIPSL